MAGRAKAAIAAWAGSLAVGAAALWAFLPQLAAWSAERILLAQGASEARIVAESIGAGGAELSEIRLLWPGRAALHLQGVRLTYLPGEILRGRVGAVEVENGSLRFDAPTERAEPATPPILPALPFRELRLRRLDLEAPPLAAVTVSGAVTRDRRGLVATLRMEREGHALGVTVRASSRDDSYDLMLAAGQGEARVSLRRDAQRQARLAMEVAADVDRPWCDAVAVLLGAERLWWLDEGRLHAQWRGSVPATMRGDLAGRLDESQLLGEFALHLQATEAASRLAGLTAVVEGGFALDGGRLRVTLGPRGQLRLPPPKFAARVLEGAPLEVRVPHGLTLETAPGEWLQDPTQRVVQGRGELHLEAVREGVGRLKARLSGLRLEADGMKLGGLLSGAGRWRLPWVAAGHLALDGAGPMSLDRNGLSWITRPGTRLALRGAVVGGERLSPVAAISRDGVTLTAAYDGRWRILPYRAMVEIPPLTRGEVGVRSRPLELRVDRLEGQGRHWQGSGAFELPLVSITAGGRRAPPLALSGTADVDSDRLRVAVEGTAAGQEGLAVVALHRFAGGRGEADLTLPSLHFAPEGLTLQRLFPGWSHPLDLGGGNIEGKMRLEWRRGYLGGQGTVEARELAGFYKDVLFSGGNSRMRLSFEGAPHWWLEARAPVSVNRLTAGVPLGELATSLELSSKKGFSALRIGYTSARLLGGAASMEPTVVEFGAREHRLEVLLHRLELEELLKLERLEGVEATGAIDGILPVTLGPNGVAIHAGRLAAWGPGVVRFRPQGRAAAWAEGDAPLALALQALRNFHYERLEGELDYAPTGDLELAVRLRGRNPELMDGRAIQLNVNIQDNIPALLTSLRVGHALAGQIEAWVRRFHAERR